MSKTAPKKKTKSRTKTPPVPKRSKNSSEPKPVPKKKTAKPRIETYVTESVMDDIEASDEVTEPKKKAAKKPVKKTKKTDVDDTVSVSVLDEKTRLKIKANANIWFDIDDALKNLGKQAKTLRKKKTELSKKLLKIQEDNGVEDAKFDVEGKDGKVRGRISNTLSVTRGPITQKLVETVIMEYSKNENMAKQIAKKIEERRPIKERRYLKRTKGATETSKE